MSTAHIAWRTGAASLIGAAALLAGCAATGDSRSQSELIPPARLGFTANQGPAPMAWPAADWWSGFHDPRLTDLVAAALADNPNIKLAEARVRLARQAETAARATGGPDLSLNATVSRERLSEHYIYPPPFGGETVTEGRVALDFSYEFDFWGKQRAALASAVKQSGAEQAEAASARLVLAVAVARTYFQLQARYADLNVAQDTVRQREAVAALTRLRARQGLDSRAEIDLPTAQIDSSRQDVAAIEDNITLLKHQIAALTGRAPGSADDLQPAPTGQAKPATVPGALPVDLPIDLLGRRADIVAQRLRLEAAANDITAAKAEFYPNVNLTAFFGVQAIGADRLFNLGSRAASVGPALHLPIFEAGRLRANLGARYAEYDIAVEQYNQTLLDAVREVADQGALLQGIARQRQIAAASRASLQRAYDVAQVRYRGGLANKFAVLNAENALLAQRRVDANLDEREAEASVGLIRALGGGYVESSVKTGLR